MQQLPLKRTVKGQTVRHTREQYIRVFISLVAGHLPADKRFVTVREKVSGGGTESLEIGSRDLILCWFLLFQFGHLYDGHIAERYFLYQLFRRGDDKERWLQVLSASLTKAAKAWLRKVLADGDWLSFHQFLAAWRIEQSETLRSSRWKWVLDTYFRFGAQPQHLHENGVKAISAFHVLRKLAYLALDMHESHGPCILNLSEVKNSLSFAEIWKWSSKYDHFGLLLNTLEVHLGYTLYTNYEVSKLNLAFLDSYRSKVESESDMTIEEWKRRLMASFREGKNLKEVEKVADEQIHLFSLPCPSVMKDLAGFQSLRSSLQSYSRFFVSSWPSIQSPVLLVDFFTKGSENFSLNHVFPILEAIDSHAKLSLQVQSLRSAFTQAMDQDAVVGCTASLRSLATFLFKALLFPDKSNWIVQHLPDYQECLASKHSLIDIAPWKLVRGPSDALAELKGFVDIQEKIGLKFSEMAEGYATLTSFAAEVTARGQARDRNHFYLVLLGSMIMTIPKAQKPELEVDGLWFEIKPGTIQLCVVEAKSGKATGDVDRKISQFTTAFPGAAWAPKQQHKLVSWTHLTRSF